MAESRQQGCVMQLRLNPLTGLSEWVVVAEKSGSDELDDLGVLKERGGSLAHTQYLDMLNDGARNRAYYQAIRKAIGEGAEHVLDIGAGTGLLSMMAWTVMNDVNCTTKSLSCELGIDGGSTAQGVAIGRITACESYLPMVRLARKLFRANGMGSGVKLIHKRSDEMEIGNDLPTPADVLVSEILDSELLGEGLIPTLRHAHAHLLKPSAQTVPYRATIYAQLVECDFLWRCHDLAGVEADLADGLLMGISKARDGYYGTSGTMHINALAKQLNLLSDPFEVFRFNFNKTPPDTGACELHVTITKAGSVHALVSWWVLELDKEGAITYSTEPDWIRTETGCSNWRDHWKQCIWYFPGRGVKVTEGEEQIIKAIHDEISVKYEIGSSKDVEGGPANGSSGDGFPPNLNMGPERIGVLGDRSRRRIMKESLAKAMKGKSSPLCLIVDDSVLCTLLAASVHSNAHVVAMLPGLQHDGSLYIQAMSHENGVNQDQVDVVGMKAAQLTSKRLNGRQVDVLIAEPYYRAYEDLLPWQHLRFWYERTSLAPLLANHPKIIPCQGILRGVAVNLPDLWHSRRCLSEVEGFDHSLVNEVLGACGALPSSSEGPLLPYSLWQCGQCMELTCPFSIMTFDFALPLQSIEGSVEVPVSTSGLCHGIALWIDWVMDEEHELVLSTGPTPDGGPNYWKQGIKLLTIPLQLVAASSRSCDKRSSLLVSAAFHSSSGDLTINILLECALIGGAIRLGDTCPFQQVVI